MSAATDPMETMNDPFRALAEAVANAQPQKEAQIAEQLRQGDITDAITPPVQSRSRRNQGFRPPSSSTWC